MKVMIIGSGVSGQAVGVYLKEHNYDCFFLNEEVINSNEIDENDLSNLIKDIDFVVVSPGISLKNSAINWIKKRKIALFGELEFAASKISNDIIAVTGTNGKTTTVKLIHYLLKRYSGGVKMGGNVGIPAISLVDKLNDNEIVVFECSSFQLETVKNFRPHIAVILNISEDHLNRHGTMKEYVRCKYKITKKQLSSDYLVLNADDELLRKNPPKTKAQIFYFSTKRKVLGCYVKNGFVYFNDGEIEERWFSISKVSLKGEHNLSNVLAAVLSIYLETRNKKLFLNLSKFEGVSHRIEFVKNVNGIEFYNDSKSTNVSSSIVACKSFSQNVGLILGGSDKGFCYDELIEKLPKNINIIAVFGENKNKIALSIKRFNYQNYFLCNDLKECVGKLYELSLPGDVILLSPASASFDQFSNYVERGNVFKKLVFDLEEKNKKS